MGLQTVFANNMRHYRKEAGYSQEKLAELSGLHRTYIGGIEQQRINVSLKNVEKIARALQIDPAQLFVDSKTSRSRCTAQSIDDVEFDDHRHALCTRTDEGIVFEPIAIQYHDLTVSILCALIESGHDDNLAEAYERAQAEILAFFNDTHCRAENSL